MTRMTINFPSIRLYHPHFALLDLKYLANEDKFSINRESNTEEASFIDINLIYGLIPGSAALSKKLLEMKCF